MAKKKDFKKNSMDNVKPAELHEIENFMVSSLQPVRPRPEFVQGLHRRLTDPMSPTVRFTRRYSSQFILLVLAAVLSGIIFFLTAGRVIISLVREFRFLNPNP